MFIPSASRPTRLEIEQEVQKIYPDAKVMSFLPKGLEPGEPTMMVPEEYVEEEKKEIPKNVKKIAKELDKAVELHASQAKRLRAAGVSENTTYKTPTGQGANYKMTDNEFREVEALKTRNFATGGKLIKNKQQSQKFTDKYASELNRRSKNVGPGEFKVDRGGKGRIPVTTSSIKTNFPNLMKKKIGESMVNWRDEIGYEGKDEVKKFHVDEMA